MVSEMTVQIQISCCSNNHQCPYIQKLSTLSFQLEYIKVLVQSEKREYCILHILTLLRIAFPSSALILNVSQWSVVKMIYWRDISSSAICCCVTCLTYTHCQKGPEYSNPIEKPFLVFIYQNMTIGILKFCKQSN